MKWKLSSLEPRMLVYYFAKFIGLAPFSLKNHEIHRPKFLDVIYPLFIAAIYSLVVLSSLAASLQKFDSSHRSKISIIGILFRHLAGFPGAFFTVIVFLLMNKRIVNMIDKLRLIGRQFRSLGIDVDNEKFFKNLLVTTAMTNAVFVVTYVLKNCLESGVRVYIVIQHGFGDLIIVNAILIFSQLLIYIRQHFTLLNRKFNDMFSPTRHTGSPHDLQMHLGTRNHSSEVLRDIQRVQKVEGLHLELCDLLDQTTHMFSIPITFISLQSLVNLSLSCHWIYHVISTTRLDSEADIASLFIDKFAIKILEIIVTTVMLLTIAHVSATTCEQGNAMKDVLCKIWIKSTPQDLQDEFFTFHLQLQHQSASVSLFGFFDLYYSYVYKIFSGVIAYMIVVVQFDTSQPRTNP